MWRGASATAIRRKCFVTPDCGALRTPRHFRSDCRRKSSVPAPVAGIWHSDNFVKGVRPMTISQLLLIHSQVERFATRLQSLIFGLVIMAVGPSRVGAQPAHSHIQDTQQNQANALVKIVRDSTERFKDVAAAMAEGYALQFGCVSGSDSGAMGLHYV